MKKLVLDVLVIFWIIEKPKGDPHYKSRFLLILSKKRLL
jgi:hypothetical protein